MNDKYIQFDTSNIKGVIKGRIEPSIYAFKTNTVPSYLKVGDTYRDVDIRLSEWSELYTDIFDIEENHKKINPVVKESAVLNKNNDIYFRDYSVHNYLKSHNINQITDKERIELSKKHNNIHISDEFFKNAKKQDVLDAINDINNNYGTNNRMYDYYNVYDKGKEEKSPIPFIEKHLRKNQEEVVNKFVEKYKKIKKGDKPLKLLMYAVMRFGKTFTAISCAKSVKAKVVVVLSAKADVHDEWRDNIEEAINFKNYKFLSKKENNLTDFKKIINGKYKQKEFNIDGKKVKENKKDSIIVFLTLQDIQGDKIKKEHKDILNSDIDIIIVDETHFGARAKSFGEVIKNTENENTKIDLNDDNKNLSIYRKYGKNNDNDNEDYYEIDDADKIINEAVNKKFKSVKTILHLSGTPYRILMSSEFPKENRIAEVTYDDILQSKKEWDAKFLKYDKISDIKDKNLKNELYKQYGLKDVDDKEIEEYDNPYYGFPNMLRFGYKPSEKSLKVIKDLKLKNDASTGLSNLLRPISITKDENEDYKKFRYNDEVLSIIKALDGKEEDKNIFPILKYEKDNNIILSKHIVMVLPYCASCDAMEQLLLNNKFDNLNEYEIINISGLNIKSEYKKVDNIKKKIEEIELRNFPNEYKEKYNKNVNKNDKKKTITLTVERMLTGSTVPYWDTMVFMRDTKDPQGYDQAIFRLQNQYIKTYKDENTNKIIKRDMKPQTLLIDFSIERMYRLTEEKEFIYNIKDNKRDNIKLQESLQRSLKNSQIFVASENKMIEATPTDIMKFAARYNSEKSILLEAKDIYFDKNILKNEIIKKELFRQQDMKNKGGLEINKDENDGSEQELDFGIGYSGDVDNNKDTKKNKNINSNIDLNDEDKIIKEWEGKWQTYCSRLLFYAFLTKSEICSLDEIINYKNDKVNIVDNDRIIRNLDINIETLKTLKNIISDILLKNISDKIMNINILSREEYKDEKGLSEFDKKLKKINVAMNKFSRLGKSEIVTPQNVCIDMIKYFTDEQLKDILKNKKKILDINSKIAEFTVAFVKRFSDMGINVDDNIDLKNMFCSIPSAGYTYEFTRYVYEILGLNIDNIAMHFTSYSLIKDKNICKNKDDEKDINEKINNIKNQIKTIDKIIKLNEIEEKTKTQIQKYNELLKIIDKDEDLENIKEGFEEELDVLFNKKSNNLNYEKISRILNQNKKFCEIRLSDENEGVDNMKFEIVTGNPPYQEVDGGGTGDSAKPIYDNFCYMAKAISNRYFCIIMPSRWMKGGKGLDNFREDMKKDTHITHIDDYEDEKIFFPYLNIDGGVCIIKYDKRYNGKVKFKFVAYNGDIIVKDRYLNSGVSDLVIRDYRQYNLIKAITDNNLTRFSEIVSERNPFGFNADYFNNIDNYKFSKPSNNKTKTSTIKIYGVKGKKGGAKRVSGYLSKLSIKKNNNSVDKYKLFFSKAYDSKSTVPPEIIFGSKDEICTETFLKIGDFKTKNETNNCLSYIKTKFFRAYLYFNRSSLNNSRSTFDLIPLQDFTDNSDIDWSKSIADIDKQLYKKYKLNKEEINFIEKMIKIM